MQVSKQRGLPVVETKKSGKAKQSGNLFVDSASIMRYNTFLDFIKVIAAGKGHASPQLLTRRILTCAMSRPPPEWLGAEHGSWH